MERAKEQTTFTNSAKVRLTCKESIMGLKVTYKIASTTLAVLILADTKFCEFQADRQI